MGLSHHTKRSQLYNHGHTSVLYAMSNRKKPACGCVTGSGRGTPGTLRTPLLKLNPLPQFLDLPLPTLSTAHAHSLNWGRHIRLMCACQVGKHFYLARTGIWLVWLLILKASLHPTKFTMLLSAQTLYRGVHEPSQASYALLNEWHCELHSCTLSTKFPVSNPVAMPS